ncbi:polysaccharide biosynthesis tyrosine autokinase [Phycisphaerales bacterium AB-hyl4]|uniref:Polysaccharide biosynthesis tyrosine autokinase n=1 Tax=Natronomicrosphaera hydrolytica TaxID=3242702 RepID=A0ABV4TZI5_9BACT
MSANLPSPISPLGPTTGMTPATGGSRFKPIDPLRVLRKYMWLLMLLVIVGVSLGIGTWYVLRTQAPSYTSQAQLRVTPLPQADSTRVASEMHQQRLDVLATFIQNEIMRLRSEDILRATLDRSEVRNTRWFQQHGHDPLRASEKLADDHLRVSMMRGTTLINVSVSTRHAADAAPILDALLAVYLQQIRRQYSQDRDDMRVTYTTERDRWAGEVEQYQRELRDFLRREDLSSLESRHNEASIAYQQLASQRVELELMLDQMRASYEAMQEQQQAGEVGLTPEQMVELEARPGIERLNSELRSYRKEREAMLDRFGEDHYQIRQMDNRIRATREERDREMQRMARELQSARLERAGMDVRSLESRAAALEPRMRSATTRLTDLNDRLTRFRQLQEQLEYARERRDVASEALDSIRVEDARPDAVPVRPHVRPTVAQLTFPQPRVVVPGVTLLVVGLGVGLILLREMLDQRLRSPQDVKACAEADLLGMVPDASEDPTDPGRIERAVARNPTGLVAESFRQVRTAIMAKMDRRGYKTLVLASAQAGGGSSAVTANLAASLALSHRSVLIVDANFRQPHQHDLAAVPQTPGLVECLTGRAKLADAVARTETENLSVLPVGDVNGAAPELLDDARFRTLLSEAEREYDIILIDAPPALLATDTQLIARHVDAIALIVRADRDTRGMTDRMLRLLDGHRADVLGLILNGIRPSAGGYLRRNYQDYYRYQKNGKTNGTTPPAGRLAAPEINEPQDTASR